MMTVAMGWASSSSTRDGRARRSGSKPQPFRWDYARFGSAGATAAAPDETIEITIVKQNAAAHGFNVWTLNGEAFSPDAMKPTYTLQRGRRYRLKFRNASDDIHPLHLHRHTFELTRVGGKATAGVMKDVVMLGGFQELELDFVADNPGLTLFHCHQQLHMDFGFMALFKYASGGNQPETRRPAGLGTANARLGKKEREAIAAESRSLTERLERVLGYTPKQ